MASRFCDHLKAAIEDEKKAGPDYINLIGELQYEVGGEVGRKEDVLADLKTILEISGDEDGHFELLTNMYERRCRR